MIGANHYPSLSSLHADRSDLLWITKLVDSGTGDAHPYQAQVSEVAFFPR